MACLIRVAHGNRILKIFTPGLTECVLASTSRNNPEYFSANDLYEAKDPFLQKASSQAQKIFHLQVSI